MSSLIERSLLFVARVLDTRCKRRLCSSRIDLKLDRNSAKIQTRVPLYHFCEVKMLMDRSIVYSFFASTNQNVVASKREFTFCLSFKI